MCKYLFKVITIIPVEGEVSSVADGKPVRDCTLVSALATGYHDVKQGHSFTSSLPSTKCNITGEISTTLSVLLNVLWHGKRKCQVDVNNALTWYNNLCVSLIVLSVRGYSYSYTPALTNQEKHGKYWKSSLGCECMCFRPLPPQQVVNEAVRRSHVVCASESGLSHWQRDTSVIDCSHYQTSNGLFLKSTWDKQAPEGPPRRASAFVFQGSVSADGAPGGCGNTCLLMN